ncbi:hypothetical protein OF83DRAFT_1081771 [Amylostereum chailletii]|nr:hypothetical protein OF83DRAFT_1081771 [Amylostereum chailletii]
MSSPEVSLQDLVQGWLSLDRLKFLQNPETRREIADLWSQGETKQLEGRLRSRIEFGTAGLRGRMEAGWARMNDLIVIQSSQGLCEYVKKTIPNAAQRGVVIGHDHRHNSEQWARLTAATFVAKGMKTYLLRGLVHTPMVPFSVKRLDAACGVMITASHNPKDDNGYKVYWENAVQVGSPQGNLIISPHDTGISTSIKANLDVVTWDAESFAFSPLYIDKTSELVDAYFEYIQSLCTSRSSNTSSDLKFVNTSMHGVSHPFVARGFSDFGFPPFTPVEEQKNPDPEFPTVKFPNPEEKGALVRALPGGPDLALRSAREANASYVLAQDPDSDRFSAAEKRPDGTWINFTGDQLGTLFAGRVLDEYKASGQPLGRLAMVASTVSSKMIEAMAAMEGFQSVECLTGFKFIGNTALTLSDQGYEVLFGYEEAIGFMIGTEIRDKDGVSATLYFAEMVANLHREGKTASSYLQELYRKYGFFQAMQLTFFVTSNSYFICSDSPTIDRIFARLRNYNETATPETPAYPQSIGGLTVLAIRDLTIGYDSSNPPTYRPILPLSSGHMIQIRAQSEDGAVKVTLTTRTSGTEPKIKYYLEGSGKDADLVKTTLANVVKDLGDQWMQADANGLGRP